jgi:hypothetical protein
MCEKKKKKERKKERKNGNGKKKKERKKGTLSVGSEFLVIASSNVKTLGKIIRVDNVIRDVALNALEPGLRFLLDLVNCRNALLDILKALLHISKETYSCVELD